MEKQIKELMKEFEQMLEENPEKVMEFTKHLYHHNPEAVKRMLMTYEDNGHIRDKKTYEELVDGLEWANKQGYGEKWSLEKIKKNSGINFEETDFSEFDYAYLVNFLFSKCCKYTQDSYIFLKIARGLLEDKHKQVKLNKGSYQEKHKNKSHGIQSYYDLFFEAENRKGRNENRRHYNYDDYENESYESRNYNEEDRRGRHRSEDEDMEMENRRGRRRYRSENDYEDRNDYENGYYKESNIGFRS